MKRIINDLNFSGFYENLGHLGGLDHSFAMKFTDLNIYWGLYFVCLIVHNWEGRRYKGKYASSELQSKLGRQITY